MTTVGVRELRDGLSRHLESVKQGGSVTVTEHGRPIARIVPLEGESVLDRLIAAGRVTAPQHEKRDSAEPIDVGATVSDLVAEQRR